MCQLCNKRIIQCMQVGIRSICQEMLESILHRLDMIRLVRFVRILELMQQRMPAFTLTRTVKCFFIVPTGINNGRTSSSPEMLRIQTTNQMLDTLQTCHLHQCKPRIKPHLDRSRIISRAKIKHSLRCLVIPQFGQKSQLIHIQSSQSPTHLIQRFTTLPQRTLTP